MTTQDQSRADFEAAWQKKPGVTKPPARFPNGGDYIYPTANTAWWAWQAARALPAGVEPAATCCKNGPPGGVCAECREASAAYQWDMSPRRTLPTDIEPAAYLRHVRDRDTDRIWFASKPEAGAEPVYTAAQVLAMGRVPPFETDAVAVNLMRLVGLNKHQARECEEVVRLVLAAAPRPPAAQDPKESTCPKN